jgi:two-component system, LytTR family, sensor histidine kinase AlgZ
MLRRLSSARWIHVGAVSVIAAFLLTAVYALTGSARISVTLQSALIHAAGMTALVTATMPRLRGHLQGRAAATRWALLIAALLVLAVVGSLLACGVITALRVRPDEPLWTCFRHDLSLCVLITLTIGISMTLYEMQRRQLDAVSLQLRERELDHERARKAALEARLQALEARLQPHFMFNTLNAISALIQEDPGEAERTVERLAALLRFSLDATGRGLVPLADEVKITSDYVEIERTRFGERLTCSIEVEPSLAGCEVPPLALQTLVENGVKHAIAPRAEGGRLRITAAAAGDTLVLGVWDDGPGFSADAVRAGHGLDMLRSRLAARFGERARLDIARRDGGTLVSVTMPRDGRPA